MLIEIEKPSWQTPVAFSGSYLAFCLFFGPRVMKNREAFSLRIPMIIFNLAQILMNAYMFYVWFSFLGFEVINFSSNVCTPLTSANMPPKLIDKVYSTYSYFYLNKITNLLNTVFFILRKKSSQVTVPHIFHHSTMVLIAYIGAFIHHDEVYIKMFSLNAFIHVIGHFYYLLSGLGMSFEKWWFLKKFITIIQFSELMMLLSTITAIMKNCHYSSVYVITLFIEIIIQLVLFILHHLWGGILMKTKDL